uniref:GDSL family lipase n=1 Tax=uncultured marine thaumarchaeote KM3_89_H08 TaxID=1456341 RepID=A0A075HVX5_9ARCH|nr:GDSL family lipase [uncultured marine thaumarchaeote KM3_89_H08]
MSVQVSYKKQATMGILGLLILFLVVEVMANVWWITQINCEFEENEIFMNMDDEEKRQLCVDLYDVKILGDELIPNQQSDSININSLGFRGEEFSIEKSADTFRIFMLGGSTMFGHGATSDKTTISGYMTTFFEDVDDNFNIEIINSGIQGADSFNELNLINTRLLELDPDMIIIYDGWNDLRTEHSPDTIQNNWNSMCELGIENNIDVVIALQPIAGFGNKKLTDQELVYAKTGTNYNNLQLINFQNDYESYAKNLDTLSSCTLHIDLRNVFDKETSPVYWDQGHVSDLGNRIVADKIYENILSLLPTQKSSSFSNNTLIDEQSIIESGFKYLFSSYKTPVMLGSFVSYETNFPLTLVEPTLDTSSKKLIFETQSKEYNSESISITIELIKNEDDNKQKILKLKTMNNSNNAEISHVTYFIKIYENNELLISDFFYTDDETLFINVLQNDSDSIKIIGDRKYDHNALIENSKSSVEITGPILKDGITYNFNIELRTLYDESNWVFSLDNFDVDVFS